MHQKKRAFNVSLTRLLEAVELGRIIGYIAAHTVTTLFYLIQKDKGKAAARAVLTNLLQIIKVAPVDQVTIEQALNLELPDFEDAVQIMAAVQGILDCLVTRYIKDYQPSLLPVIQPVDFVSGYED